jgi:hypothetical protein
LSASGYNGVLSGPALASLGIASTTQTFAIVPQTGDQPNYLLKLGAPQADWFLQDSFTARPNFHLTAGVRFHYLPLPFDNSYFNNALQLASSNPCGTGTTCSGISPLLAALTPGSLANDFDPQPFSADARFGFAWNPKDDGKTVIRGGWGRYTGEFPAALADESRNVFPSFLTLTGAPTTTAGSALIENAGGITGPSGGIIALNGQTPQQLLLDMTQYVSTNSILANLSYPSSGLKAPYSTQEDLMIERRIGSAFVASIAYVGTHGRRLPSETTPDGGPDRSEVTFGSNFVYSINGSVLFPFPFPSGATKFAPGTQIGTSPLWDVSSTVFGNAGVSDYHSLQTTISRSFRGGFGFASTLTWSHSIDNVSDFTNLAGAYALPQNSADPSERGSANFDVRLRSVSQLMLDTTSFARKEYLKHFQLSGIVMLQTAQPYTVNTSVDVNMDGNATDRLNTSCLVPGSDPRTQWQAPNPGGCLAIPGQDGMVGRNTFRGWGLYNTDVALSRTIRIRAEHTLQLRAEVFNVLNHPDFGIPDRILESPAFGRAVTTVAPPRTTQLNLKYVF